MMGIVMSEGLDLSTDYYRQNVYAAEIRQQALRRLLIRIHRV